MSLISDFQLVVSSSLKVKGTGGGLPGVKEPCLLVAEATSLDEAPYLNVAPAVSEEILVSASRRQAYWVVQDLIRWKERCFLGISSHYITCCRWGP
jgi:hypothetical protein